MPANITVTILTKNSEKYLKEVLESLKDFNEVLIYDNGSIDRTFEIAQKFSNVTIHKAVFQGFGKTHNTASNTAKNDWILSIDSDEVVSHEMCQEILALDLSPDAVYSFPRKNYFKNHWIWFCGWYPDRVFRLYNRKKTRFTDAYVHESVIVENMSVIECKSPIIHYSYSSQNDFLAKMQSYSSLFAEQNYGKKKSSPLKAILHGIGAFFKSYFIKFGFLGGFNGLMISIYNGNTAFYKYLKLYELNCKNLSNSRCPEQNE